MKSKQSLREQAKTLKIVFTGDVHQIDTPYLDETATAWLTS